MDETTPEDGSSNVDFIRQRWASMGLDRSEAAVQAAAKAMDEEDARQLKERAQAVLTPGNSRTPEPDEDIDDAWHQHDEEKAAEHAQGRPTPEREPVSGYSLTRELNPQDSTPLTDDGLDDIYQSLRDEYRTEPKEFDTHAEWSNEDLDDSRQQYEEEQPWEPPEEAEPKPEVEDPQVAPTPVAKGVESAVRHRRPRRPVVPRTMPHGNSTGVWLPREVWEDSRFESTDERVLYLEVNHLDKEDGCTATNRHFAEYLGCSIQTIQDMIQEMTGRGIFTCSYPSRRSRIIHIVGGRRDYSRHRS